MSTGLQTIDARIVNPELWSALEAQIAHATALPPAATPEALATLISGALALLYRADADGDADPLRGTFSDSVVAQVSHNPHSLLGARPTAASIEWVGARMAGEHPVVRAHVSIEVELPGGAGSVQRQFWDLQLGGQVTVAPPACPTCGAPLAAGEVVCNHCGTDVRESARPDVVVTRLELY